MLKGEKKMFSVFLFSPSFLDKSREKLALALESGVDDAMVSDARTEIQLTVNSVMLEYREYTDAFKQLSPSLVAYS